MQSKLKEMAIILGYEGSEIFPKQTEILVERGDTGNFLNLPYYNNTKGLRYAIDDNGNALELEQFYTAYDKYSCTRGDVEGIRVAEKKREEAFPLGPPCLNKLAVTGFGQGSRNNALFNIAVFYKQSDVAITTELAWILSTYFPYQRLTLAHSFKDKSNDLKDVNVGLFTYPMLMAADILLYDANYVPVGKDQLQHLEITRDVAIKFNNKHGETFLIPEAKVNESTKYVTGTN